MRAKSRLLPLLALIVVLGLGAGCNKLQRSDAQVAADLQQKIAADKAISSKDITAQAVNGVVTLSGNVASETERIAAANDAASVPGVKTVINNLQVGPDTNPVAQAPAPEPARKVQRAGQEKPSARQRHGRSAAMSESDQEPQEVAVAPPSPAPVAPPAPAPAPVANTTPPPPPAPSKVTIPAGTRLSVRLIDGLDSEKNQVGDTFHGTLNTPITMDDQVVIPRDADVQGRVVDVKSAGRFAGGSNLTIELNALTVNGKAYNIETNQWARNGTGQGKKTASKTGGGALLGAIIGGIAGGGRGAAIGTVAGGAAGAGTAAATNKANQIKLAPEALISFSLQNDLTVTPQSTTDRNAGRQPLNQ